MNAHAKLFVFHPSPYMVDELDVLLSQHAPELEVENVIIPELLDTAMQTGITKDLRAQVEAAISKIPSRPKCVILCSCSTFGGCAEEMQSLTENSVIRIDRPMAELAVDTGQNIGVAAAVESTIGPTKDLLHSVAEAKGKHVNLHEILCSSAWERRQHNDKTGYIDEIVSTLENASSCVDVMVLAQGSMAPAVERLNHLPIPVLSSPLLAVERVVRMCRDIAA